MARRCTDKILQADQQPRDIARLKKPAFSCFRWFLKAGDDMKARCILSSSGAGRNGSRSWYASSAGTGVRTETEGGTANNAPRLGEPRSERSEPAGHALFPRSRQAAHTGAACCSDAPGELPERGAEANTARSQEPSVTPASPSVSEGSSTVAAASAASRSAGTFVSLAGPRCTRCRLTSPGSQPSFA